MKKIITICLFAFLGTTSLNAQKITFKGDTMLVDEKPYCLLVKEGCKLFQNCQYFVKSLTGNLLVAIKYEDYKENTGVYNGRVQTSVTTCANFNFLTTKTVAQIKSFTTKIEKVGKEIYNNQFFKDGEFNNDAATNFVLINPQVYPRKDPTTIIINEQSTPPANNYNNQGFKNCSWIDAQDYSNAGDEGRGVSSWDAHYVNGINPNQVKELGGLIRRRLTTLQSCLDLSTYAQLYADIATKIASYGIRYSGWKDVQDSSFPQDAGRGVTIWIDHFNAVKNGGNADIPQRVDNRINMLLYNLSRENFARLYADVSVIIARYGVNGSVNNNPPSNGYRNCSWIDGQDRSLGIDQGRGVTDWNAHFSYGQTTSELHTCANYLSTRLFSLTTCLDLNTYAQMYADISTKIASYGIAYAGWKDGQDPMHSSDPGRGVTVWVDHYNFVKNSGNSSVPSTVQNRLKSLSNILSRSNYARLYADVSVIVARYGVYQRH